MDAKFVSLTESPQLAQLAASAHLDIYPYSPVISDGTLFFLARTEQGKQLGILVTGEDPRRATFEGTSGAVGVGTLLLAPLTHANALALRMALPWLQPTTLGLKTSAGCGDRLGLATPGHVRATRAVLSQAHAGVIAPIFAQQSIREMVRTGRNPDDVMDDATWGVFQEGWGGGPEGALAGIGADADHLKTPEDADRCAAAGFTFFTVDPGDHVDAGADTAAESVLRGSYAALPWDTLEETPEGLLRRYTGRRFELEDRALAFDDESLMRSAAKYGKAVAHAALMYRHLTRSLGTRPWELEVSVDETHTPTSHVEHLFVASELRRLGVQWVSLAPRYVGRFEKGVDYISASGARAGGLDEFERDFAGHAAIARALGPYKLSLHSGSDKFSIYVLAARHARGLVHLKTAGTSYLEALRAVAEFDPALFRAIAGFALERYETDQASYHVSADLGMVPAIERLSDAELPSLLEQFDARQVLHVTFGSVLTANRGFREPLMAGLVAHEELYYRVLESHFIRHLSPLLSAV